MIKDMIGACVAAALIIGAAAFVLVVTPVHACETMVASHYGTESGNRTANGERFDGSDMTAAHKTLPFGTRLKVSYGGKSVVVRVNDRGPWIKGRDLDLSTAAARQLGLNKAGVGRVKACRNKDAHLSRELRGWSFVATAKGQDSFATILTDAAELLTP